MTVTDTARDLLAEASRTLELLPPEESGDLLTRIAMYLEQPVHVGDTITLQAGYPKDGEDDPNAEGFTTLPYKGKHREFDFETREYTGKVKTFEGEHRIWPEAGPTRCYDMDAFAKGIVVPINGIRYRVGIAVDSNDWGGSPDGAVVTFTRTEDEETPFTPYTVEEGAAEQIGIQRQNIERFRAEIEEEEGAEEPRPYFCRETYDRMILEAELSIYNLEHGADRPWPNSKVHFFGQPCFIQNEITPAYEGGAAMHLATLETGWGDSGNVNILFACDENGVPCRVWFEASCC